MRILWIVLIVLLPLSAFAADPNTFGSVTAGFKITKPNDWLFITAEENLEILKRLKLEDEEFHQKMVKHARAPLVAMMKYGEPYEDLNPSFKVGFRPYGQLNRDDPKDILRIVLPQFEKAYKDFELVQPPMDASVGGQRAAYMRFHFTLSIPDGRTFPTRSELWIVPRGNHYFYLGAGIRQDEKNGTKEEIQKILSSVEFKP